MRLHVVQAADSGDLDALRDAARAGRAAAISRRRALAAGKAATEAAAPPAASSAQGAPSGAQGSAAEKVVALDGGAAARLGRAFSMHRRRQMSQGKQALNGGGDCTPAAAGAEAPTLSVYRGGAR